ncbi:MAG: hypothetical protein ACOCXP_02820 [Candidatus Dojkabacteria bacterium]
MNKLQIYLRKYGDTPLTEVQADMESDCWFWFSEDLTIRVTVKQSGSSLQELKELAKQEITISQLVNKFEYFEIDDSKIDQVLYPE